MDFLVNIVDGMQAVMDWWAPVFEATERLQEQVADYSYATGEFTLEKDIMRYICTAMDLYYSAVSIQVSVYTGNPSDFTPHLV